MIQGKIGSRRILPGKIFAPIFFFSRKADIKNEGFKNPDLAQQNRIGEIIWISKISLKNAL